MYVAITGAAPARIELREHLDCRRFHVSVPSEVDSAALAAVFAESGAGTVDGSGALVEIGEIRRMALELGVDPDWHERFARMVAYATEKGWVSADGARFAAHVVPDERPGTTGRLRGT
ncbi:hypothetical protein [Amycolatopsis sp. cmx-4-68]|uniref:hypothetical protein n=1 Tax=Amycolatopsis sp. cmx-4-68 TaxID=2790938 RepID=UPI00397A4B7C